LLYEILSARGRAARLRKVQSRMSGAATPQFIVFACDESAAKGYADRDEQFPGEVGVFAGIIVPSELLSSAQAQFDAIAKKYETTPGKVHIAALTATQQGQLRKEVFDLIEQLHLPCLFEATHGAGFHAYFRQVGIMVARGKTQRRSPVKVSGIRCMRRYSSASTPSFWHSAWSVEKRFCISKCGLTRWTIRSSRTSKRLQKAYWSMAPKSKK